MKYYTVAEIARLLPRADGRAGGLGKSRTYALIADESLRAEKCNGKTVVRQAELERFLREYQPRQVKRPISFDDAVDRVAAVLDKRASMTQAAHSFPRVSVSYISRLARGERWPRVLEAALKVKGVRKSSDE